MARLLKVDGTSAVIDRPLTLAVMQELVGGYIEVVTIGGRPNRRELLIVDEEGLLKGKPFNPTATGLYRGIIVGDAIHCVCVDMGLDTESYE
jgi:hypothetical protein